MSQLLFALFGPLHEWDAPIPIGLIVAVVAVWVLSLVCGRETAP